MCRALSFRFLLFFSFPPSLFLCVCVSVVFVFIFVSLLVSNLRSRLFLNNWVPFIPRNMRGKFCTNCKTQVFTVIVLFQFFLKKQNKQIIIFCIAAKAGLLIGSLAFLSLTAIFSEVINQNLCQIYKWFSILQKIQKFTSHNGSCVFINVINGLNFQS